MFDLELPLDFIPENADGEVETFELLPAAQCLEKLFSADFKTTSVPVALDFLIRHGLVTPENGKGVSRLMEVSFCFLEKEFIKVVELLHVPLQSIYSYSHVLINSDVKENGIAKMNSA